MSKSRKSPKLSTSLLNHSTTASPLALHEARVDFHRRFFGNLGEMVAALVTGIRGMSEGQTAAGNTGDLSDGTEVKAYTVCETNIDFLVHGTLHRLPNAVVFGFSRDEELTTIDMRDIRNQINSVSSNLLQVLQEHDGRWIGSQHLYRTSTNALRRIDDGGLGVGITHEQLQQLCRDNGLRVSGSKAVLRERLLAADVDGVPNLEDGLYLVMRSETEGHENEHFSYDESLFNGEHYWSFRKERSHINFGGKTREQLREILKEKESVFAISWTHAEVHVCGFPFRTGK